MAGRLELDAAITEPIVHEVLAELTASVRQVLDVGCGPGAVTIAIARALPDSHVTALDASEALLDHVARSAHDAGVGDRVDTVPGDLDTDLPALPQADLVWAGMVLHHVTDPTATLQRLHDALVPGGTLVMIEFGDPPSVLPDDAPLLLDGTWPRFQAATASVLTERLGLDPVLVDWPTHLHSAGFVDITDRGREAVHPAPLGEVARSWLVAHLEGGVRMATERLDDHDAAGILELAASVPDRTDLTVRARRRVVIARRPHAATVRP
jgi:SAM-dependent methyltransferase